MRIIIQVYLLMIRFQLSKQERSENKSIPKHLQRKIYGCVPEMRFVNFRTRE